MENYLEKATTRTLFAEAIGSFALVFVGCGAIVVNDLYGGSLGNLGIGIVFALIVMAMIYSVGNISGAHFNPPVTLGFWSAGRLQARPIFPYITGQVIGALVAALLLRLLFPEHTTLGATPPAIDAARAFVLEVLGAFILIFVILNVSSGHFEKGIMAGAAIGGVVAMLAIFAGPVTGASFNPARSLAPALASMQLEALWLYLLAPVCGTWLASQSCRLVQGADCCPAETGLCSN